MDLLLDMQGSRDMVFVNGECPITETFTDSVAQKVFIMLRTFQGEWYLDAECGPPYFQRILGQKVEKRTVDRILQEKILAVDGVADILSFVSTLNERREYSASVRIRDISSQIFTETLTVGI